MTRCLTCQTAETAEALGNEEPTIRTLQHALNLAANDKLRYMLVNSALRERVRDLEQQAADQAEVMAEKDATIGKLNRKIMQFNRRKARQ